MFLVRVLFRLLVYVGASVARVDTSRVAHDRGETVPFFFCVVRHFHADRS